MALGPDMNGGKKWHLAKPAHQATVSAHAQICTTRQAGTEMTTFTHVQWPAPACVASARLGGSSPSAHFAKSLCDG